MLKALKASKRNPIVCCLYVWKSLKADMSMFTYPGPRTAPLREFPKALESVAPKAHAAPSALMRDPGSVQGTDDGSVPNQFPGVFEFWRPAPTDRWTILGLKYWFARDVPKLLELLPGP